MSDNHSQTGSHEKGIHTRHTEAGPEDIRQVLEVDGTTAKVLHADGTIDYVDTSALGGELETMPKGYFRSPQFIGTVTVRFHEDESIKIFSLTAIFQAQCFASIVAYLGWVLPANTL